MREDLIERLNEAWRKLYGDGDEHGVCDTLAEAAAALESAREDAERYRWLRKGESDDVAVVRGLGAMDYGMSAVAYTYSEEIDGDELDAAIDQARGKGVA